MKAGGPIVNLRTGETVAQSVEIADGFWSRLRGLQFRKDLGKGKGLLLVPCGAIHTCMMRFPIDIFFLDRSGVVLKKVSDLKPWRAAAAPKGTHAVLEFRSEGGGPIESGDRLSFARAGD